VATRIRPTTSSRSSPTTTRTGTRPTTSEGGSWRCPDRSDSPGEGAVFSSATAPPGRSTSSSGSRPAPTRFS
jgi:hypothetical protein